MEAPSTAVVERAQRKDADAFAVLIRAYERAALSIAFGILRDASAAGEVAQEAFIRAWERLKELREPQRFGPWLCGIVRNLAIDEKRRRRPIEPLQAASGIAEAPQTQDPALKVEEAELRQKIAQAIQSLDENSRVVVLMRYYEGLSSKQIADLLDISAAAVDMRLSRARAELKTMLKDIAAEKDQGRKVNCEYGRAG